MKILATVIAGLAIAAAAPVLAQSAPAPAAAAGAKHYSTADTPIGTLLADPAAKAIVDKRIPGFSANPQISMVSSATLAQIQPMKPDLLTDALLASIDADLAKLPATK